MIFFGKKASVLKIEKIFGLTCPSCQTQGSIHGAVVGNYAHVYWIPTFPTGRTVTAQCEHCRKTFDAAEMPPQMHDAIAPLLSETKSPLKHFSGLMVIGGLVLLGAYIGMKNDAENKKYLVEPAVGDVYEIQIEYKDYTTKKVLRVTADSVFLAENEYSVNKKTGISSINKEKNYVDTGFGYSRAELPKLMSNGTIMDINR